MAAFSLLLVACNENSHVESDAGQDHEHEEVKFQYTNYSENFEYFAESDPFVLGEECNVLSHFTWLSNFKPLVNARITLKLIVNTSEVSESVEGTDHPGIYSFNLQPKVAGNGKLIYEIQTGNETFQVEVPGITVFENDEAAHKAAEEAEISSVNSSVFTKEQSWKIDFRTELPVNEPFGQVIKTVAQVLVWGISIR